MQSRQPFEYSKSSFLRFFCQHTTSLLVVTSLGLRLTWSGPSFQHRPSHSSNSTSWSLERKILPVGERGILFTNETRFRCLYEISLDATNFLTSSSLNLCTASSLGSSDNRSLALTDSRKFRTTYAQSVVCQIPWPLSQLTPYTAASAIRGSSRKNCLDFDGRHLPTVNFHDLLSPSRIEHFAVSDESKITSSIKSVTIECFTACLMVANVTMEHTGRPNQGFADFVLALDIVLLVVKQLYVDIG